MKEAGVDARKAEFCESDINSWHGPPGPRPIAQGKFYDRDGTIIGEIRAAANDFGPTKMRPSDILFAQWETFASHTRRDGSPEPGKTNNVDTLRNFVGHSIISRSAFETIRTAHTKTGKPLDQPAVFRRASSGGEKNAFDALTGTDSLSSVNHMLKDHHNALGNKRIKEIHTYPLKADFVLGGIMAMNLVARFEPF